jgi:hypothetical protein
MERSDQDAVSLLESLRREGISAEDAVARLKEMGFGLISIMKALHDVERMSLREAAGLMDKCDIFR